MAKLKKKPEEDEVLMEEVEIEEVDDQEEEYDSSFEYYVSRYRNYLIGAGILILVVIGGLIYMNVNEKAQSREARNQMFKAIQYFEQDSLALALDGDGIYPGFLTIASDYDGTPEANLANYYLGIIYLEQGDLEQGVYYLKAFDKSDNMLSMSANMALGFAHEDMGDPESAAEYFFAAANSVNKNELTTPKMLLNAGRNYEAASQPDKARQMYARIQSEYPNSAEGRQIDKFLGRVAQ